jgi:uncharacterized membrane protein
VGFSVSCACAVFVLADSLLEVVGVTRVEASVTTLQDVNEIGHFGLLHLRLR